MFVRTNEANVQEDEANGRRNLGRSRERDGNSC